MFNVNDFNVVTTDVNGHFIRIEELNKMVKCGAITINRKKLEEHKMKTRIDTQGIAHKYQELCKNKRLVELVIKNLRHRGASKYEIEAELNFRKENITCENQKCFGYSTEELRNALNYWDEF